jgi:FSR family fosmidomycin resistance protein-like MFS transporter
LTAIERDNTAVTRGPLFVIAGSHASLHWCVTILFVLLPFIKDELGLDYTQTGFLVTIVQLAAFVANIPSGIIVDVTGRRTACKLISLTVCGLGLAGLGFAQGYWALATFVAIISITNTLWHPAAIAFLSESYADRRGLALSFHTIGASLGDAAAPTVAIFLIGIIGWQSTAVFCAIVPIAAAALLFFFAKASPAMPKMASSSSLRDYITGMRQLIRDLEIWKVCVMAGFRGTGQSGLRTFLPLYVAAAFASHPFWIGASITVLQLSGAVATPFAGGLSDRIGRRPVLFLGFAISFVVIGLMPLTDSMPLLIFLVGLAGVSTFAVRPVIQSWAMEKASPQMGGSMVSLLFGTQSAFAMAVPVLGGMIADVWGIEYVFYALAATVVIAVAVAITIPEDGRN